MTGRTARLVREWFADSPIIDEFLTRWGCQLNELVDDLDDRVYLLVHGDLTGDIDTVRVKIGRSRNPRSRESSHRTSSPTPVAMVQHTIPGGRAMERNLHIYCRDYRVRGEWFDLPFGVYDDLEEGFSEISLLEWLCEKQAEAETA